MTMMITLTYVLTFMVKWRYRVSNAIYKRVRRIYVKKCPCLQIQANVVEVHVHGWRFHCHIQGSALFVDIDNDTYGIFFWVFRKDILCDVRIQQTTCHTVQLVGAVLQNIWNVVVLNFEVEIVKIVSCLSNVTTGW